PCPLGTWSDISGLGNVSDCTPCPGGYYCDQQALTAYSKLCTEGYYCRQYASSATPSQGQDADQCPAGFYCPEGTAEPLKCPLGTYSSNVMLISETQCLNCTPGYYCGDLNLTTLSGQCSAGFYCPQGATVANYLSCPEGHYCPVRTDNPHPCPAGTYSNITNLAELTQCTNCPGGYYCETPGLSEPTGLCGEGYYCPEGSQEKEPASTYCPIGHYCPQGVSQAIPCRNNTFVNYTHAVSCVECPAGYYCVMNGQSNVCPMGYYCPSGTGLDWKSCPRGTYSDIEGLYTESQCR
ncbi:hypothetical protein LSH36_283g03025, partial [Paralvinella palmiformis]